MKKLILFLTAFFIAVSVSAQSQRNEFIKIDTTVGHGYEVKFIGKLVPRKTDTFNKVKSIHVPITINLLYETRVTWNDAKDKATTDSGGWLMPTYGQLNVVRNSLRTSMKKKNIRLGYQDWQGLDGMYWCLNNLKNDLSDFNAMAAGSVANSSFTAISVSGAGLIKDNQTYKMVLIRVY